LKNKLVAVLGMTNLLNNSGFNADFKGLNVSSSYNRQNETRMLKVSLTYNFGGFKSKEDENFNQKRENFLNPLN
jgi:iron complex outermembrane recepter protein